MYTRLICFEMAPFYPIATGFPRIYTFHGRKLTAGIEPHGTGSFLKNPKTRENQAKIFGKNARCANSVT